MAETKRKNTCATCKHCIRVARGSRIVMTCKQYWSNIGTVLCDPPYDEACGRYEEVEREN